ncbi:hypothetical protein ACFE04_002643 [Oxalis oulophora]
MALVFMVHLLLLLPLFSILPLLTSSTQNPIQPNAVTVSDNHLSEISSSVLKAEAWVKTNVLAHYPQTKITNIIIVGNNEEQGSSVILPSVKNIYYSLTRWGLEKEIKVSVFVKDDVYLNKELIDFLISVDSTLTVENPLTIKKLGFFIDNFNQNLFKRKLFSYINPYPARPTPLPLISPSQPQGPYATSTPPLASSPYAYTLPPCSSSPPPGPTPMPRVQQKLWCVAKPSVPEETLQEAIDYACGAGGADCEEIMPRGSCYYPDTVVAHASYAFNSYWQKNKRNGGSCSFGGTAMLINADPSFLQCRFVLA